jgi:hypothetical protein
MNAQDANPYASPQESVPKEPWRLFIARGVIVASFAMAYLSFPFTISAFYEFVRSTKVFSNPNDCLGFSVGFGFILCPCIAIPGFILAKWIYPDINKHRLPSWPRV